MDQFLTRLRQRKLVQWTLGYAAGAFGLIQVLDIVGQRFDWPDTVMRAVIVMLAVGLCVAVVLAWYHGERGAQRMVAAEILILMVLLVTGEVSLWQVLDQHGRTALAEPATAEQAPAKSIAVLPFDDLSPAHDQAYFSDGIAEELLNALAQVQNLKVAGRASSSCPSSGTSTARRMPARGTRAETMPVSKP